MQDRFPLPDWNTLAGSDDRTLPLLGTALLIARDEYPQLDADHYDAQVQGHRLLADQYGVAGGMACVEDGIGQVGDHAARTPAVIGGVDSTGAVKNICAGAAA